MACGGGDRTRLYEANTERAMLEYLPFSTYMRVFTVDLQELFGSRLKTLLCCILHHANYQTPKCTRNGSICLSTAYKPYELYQFLLITIRARWPVVNLFFL